MINNIQHSFSISDLELLSGIKAHTIRIWEKRYAILNPLRVDRNIRVYNTSDLQKLLNISFLQRDHYKISEISKLSDSELDDKVRSASLTDLSSHYHINKLIVSMFSLDDVLFEDVYQDQIKTLCFSDIFIHTYLPLLNHIGQLWQTNSLNPSNEHFISNLIYQKIAINIAQLRTPSSDTGKVNILFLPQGEVHEIGLYYMVYHLKRKGERTIYLGREVLPSHLFETKAQFKEIHYLTYFMLNRTSEEKLDFLSEINALLDNTTNTCSIVGRIWKDLSSAPSSPQVKFYEGLHELVLK